MKINNRSAGIMNVLLIPIIILGVTTLAFGSFSIWSYVSYSDQKNNVDQKINAAVEAAKKEQTQADQKVFLEREKEPYRQFVGPNDLGRVTFNYPKTWSVYNGTNDSGRQFQAYLQPGVVQPIVSKKPYALRVSIESRSYAQILTTYQTGVKKGDLKTSRVAVEGLNGTRLDGNFTKDIKGSMVVFKVRDKTLRVYTEADTFRPDFDKIILKSLSFNP